ncbi:hypothetical protein F2P81_018702 [Scophthalmus maximus]|uniref:Uncharacterized protein n=1 Tax=Scophthalmus maximus TaxID=52904 RepID=A0A6A4S8W4_SCOMX|nr:hypothetical protein F2P81_018702 [Scophthalmus maximus]
MRVVSRHLRICIKGGGGINDGIFSASTFTSRGTETSLVRGVLLPGSRWLVMKMYKARAPRRTFAVVLEHRSEETSEIRQMVRMTF